MHNCCLKAISLIDPRGGIGSIAGVLRSGSTEKLALRRPRNAHATDAEAVSYHRTCIDLPRQSRPVAGLRSLRQCHDGEAQHRILATRHRTCARQLTLSGEDWPTRVRVKKCYRDLATVDPPTSSVLAENLSRIRAA